MQVYKILGENIIFELVLALKKQSNWLFIVQSKQKTAYFWHLTKTKNDQNEKKC